MKERPITRIHRKSVLGKEGKKMLDKARVEATSSGSALQPDDSSKDPSRLMAAVMARRATRARGSVYGSLEMQQLLGALSAPEPPRAVRRGSLNVLTGIRASNQLEKDFIERYGAKAVQPTTTATATKALQSDFNPFRKPEQVTFRTVMNADEIRGALDSARHEHTFSRFDDN